MPLVRPVTAHEPETPVTAQVAPPGEAVIVYEVATTPLVAAVTVTVADRLPKTTLGADGIFGGNRGVTAADADQVRAQNPAAQKSRGRSPEVGEMQFLHVRDRRGQQGRGVEIENGVQGVMAAAGVQGVARLQRREICPGWGVED